MIHTPPPPAVVLTFGTVLRIVLALLLLDVLIIGGLLWRAWRGRD